MLTPCASDSRPISRGGARRDLWTRHSTDEGRVYYFNKAVGASQWHVPNEFYAPKFPPGKRIAKSCSDPSLTRSRGRGDSRGSGCGSASIAGGQMLRMKRDLTIMPAFAKATRRVDCVTEFLMPEVEEADVVRNLDGTVVEVTDAPPPELITQEVLRVVIRSARGLRDTDFMPGVDKSDPYCVCGIEGKPETRVATGVMFDCLDPCWDYETTVGPYTQGDALTFTVFDSDATLEADGDLDLGALGESDDLLGKITVSPEELMGVGGPKELRLLDTGDDMNSYLSVEVNGPCFAFPELVGLDRDVAVDLLARARPDLVVDVLEAPSKDDKTYSVISWDMVCANGAYTENFFGAYEDNIKDFKEGDLIEIYPNYRLNGQKLQGNKRFSRMFTFSHIGGLRTRQQTVRNKMVRYVYVKEMENGVNVRDGVQWRRFPRPRMPGFNPTRVHVYVDPVTNAVMSLPRNG